MKLPNKINTYKDSIISKLPIILISLEENDKTPKKLYSDVKNKFISITDYIDALDCLYALGKISFINDEVLHKC